MPQDISGKIALITGASAGIGAATARALAAQGCHLVLAARRLDRLEALKQEIIASNDKVKVHCLQKDMTDLSAVEATPSELPEDLQAVDIIVNNAGLAIGTAAGHQLDMKNAEVMMQTNVLGVMAMTRAFAPLMVERNSGHIVNISSIAAHEAYATGCIYSATKHALDAYTTSLRHDLVATKVRVTAISPGATKTEFSLVRYAGDVEKANALYAGIEPLTADDIAEDIVYAVTRPAHVQVGEIITLPTHQSSITSIARVLQN